MVRDSENKSGNHGNESKPPDGRKRRGQLRPEEPQEYRDTCRLEYRYKAECAQAENDDVWRR